jgi:hypothetical protein
MPAAREPAAIIFCQLIALLLVGIPAGIGSNRRRKSFQIQLVMVLADCRPGHQSEQVSNNNILYLWFDS